MEKTILLVEDSPDAIELSRHALSECGEPEGLIVASDGQEALDFIFGTGRYEGRNLREMPGLVLLDLKLPKLSGFEVLEKIRSDRRTRYIPVVVHTVSKLKSDILKAYDLGTNSYITKSEDFEKYSSKLKKICDYWLWLNVSP